MFARAHDMMALKELRLANVRRLSSTPPSSPRLALAAPVRAGAAPSPLGLPLAALQTPMVAKVVATIAVTAAATRAAVAAKARARARACGARVAALHSHAVVLLVLPSRPASTGPWAPSSATTRGHPNAPPPQQGWHPDVLGVPPLAHMTFLPV
jgi:hypothetical protein